MLDRLHAAHHIAHTDFYHAHGTEILDGIARQFDGIVEKFSQIVDAALAWPDEHDEIVGWRRNAGDGLGMRMGFFFQFLTHSPT